MVVEASLKLIFKLMVGLYPQEFRRQFGGEMESVFAQALDEAGERGLGAELRLLGRELGHLPGSLLEEHGDAWRHKEGSMYIATERSGGEAGPGLGPGLGWGEAFLAALPYLLIWIVGDFPRILVWAGLLPEGFVNSRVSGMILMILGGGALLAVLVYAWRHEWPLWSASWYLFYGLVALLLVGQLASLLPGVRMAGSLPQEGLYIGLPLVIAVTLYWVARHDRLKGVLAALPAIYYLWQPQMEFVPDGIQCAIQTASTILIVMAVLATLRLGDWRRGLWIALGMTVLVGMQFSYAGIYHGGALPFTALGPSLLEVVKNFIPTYLVAGSILLGPLLACMFREIGHRGGMAGVASYHIALGSLLVILVTNLVSIMPGTMSDVSNLNLLYSLLGWLLYAGITFYALAVFTLYWAARRSQMLPGPVEGGLLALLPLGMPLTFATPFITWKWPVSELYGVPWMWVLPDGLTLGVGGLWLLLTAWLVTREAGRRASPAAVPQPG